MSASKKILVVEDEADFAKGLQVILEANGFEVHLAWTGKEGLALAKRLIPDLIILDIMLPEIDGYKLCRLLKFDERYREIPVIILTARTQEEDKLLGKQTGADAYLVKGQKPQLLIEEINRLLSKKTTPPPTA